MCAVRPLIVVAAWICATAAAVAVSWFGVRTVVRDAVMPLPQLAVPADAVPGTAPPPPGISSAGTSSRPTTAPTGPTVTAPTTTRSTGNASTRGGTSSNGAAPTTTTTATGTVQRYALKGGEVVLDLRQSDATLVSATPAEGYAVQQWQENGWLRVDFNAGNATSTLIATWNGHPPSVQTYES